MKIERDQNPREDTTLEKLATLKPAYTADGQDVELPLYLAEMDLDAGAILDLQSLIHYVHDLVESSDGSLPVAGAMAST